LFASYIKETENIKWETEMPQKGTAVVEVAGTTFHFIYLRQRAT
jgi:hypothetical protein